MINHFRSVALNVSAAGLSLPYTPYNIHIDPTYAAIVLPTDLAQLYSLFYPTGALEAKLQLTQAYLSLLEGCGLVDAMLVWDNRVTYEIVSPDDPKNLRRISVGVPTTVAAQSPSIALRVFNYKYSPGWLKTPLTRTFSIEQQSNTNTVHVLEDATLILNTTLSFSGGYSNLVSIPDPENVQTKMFDFQIKHPTSPAFTSTSGKKWNVTFSIAYADLIERQVKELTRQGHLINGVISNYKVPAAQSYDRMGIEHFSSVYQLAGVFVGLIYRMNALTLARNESSPYSLQE